MTIPVYVAVAQWALLLALGALVIIMYRHLGRVVVKKVNPELGPAVGTMAASFEYMRLSDQTLQQVAPGGGRAMLLAFVEPSCLSCEQLVATMGTAADSGELSGLRVLLLISEPPRYVELSDAFRDTRLEVGHILRGSEVRAYRVSATPLLVAIDSSGVVRSAGPARDIDEVRAFGKSCLLPSAAATIDVTAAYQATAEESAPGADLNRNDKARMTRKR